MMKAMLIAIMLVGIILLPALDGPLGAGWNKKGESTPLHSPSRQAPEEGSVFKLASPWVPKSIDPAVEGFILMRMHIAETLVGVDYAGNLEPCLAQSWEVSGDGLTWTFQLRDGVRFHDGTPLTADAVKASLERTFEKTPIFKLLPVIEVRIVEKYTITITTSEPFAPLAGYLASDSALIISPASLNDKGEFIKPVGTGAFKFDSWSPKESITAVRFYEYWGNKPKLKKVIYLGVPDAKIRATMLKAGDIDMARLLPPASVSDLENNPNIVVYKKTRIGRVLQLMLNTENPTLADKRVRKAINYAINRKLICETLLEGIDEPATGPFSHELMWANKKLEGYSHNPEKAVYLLEEAGWIDSDKDGIREKEGKELILELFTYPSRPELPAIAEVTRHQLGKVGIKINVRILDWAAIGAQARKGKVDLFLLSRATYWNNDPDSWARDFHPESEYHCYINYYPPDVVSLIEKGSKTVELEKRKQTYDDLQERILEDAPVAYLTYYTNVVAVRSNVRGYEEHPTEYCFHLENVYKEER